MYYRELQHLGLTLFNHKPTESDNGDCAISIQNIFLLFVYENDLNLM